MLDPETTQMIVTKFCPEAPRDGGQGWPRLSDAHWVGTRVIQKPVKKALTERATWLRSSRKTLPVGAA